ncbi:dihydrolipoyl dehydrogenase [Alphaproteobacteria bacterium]|nr:dihydrolipoyl dehydrogenase [Alphaproteobacteria bacterium]
MSLRAFHGTGGFDIVVVGGGVAGAAAAIRAAELGLSVAVAERGQLGGAGLGAGCTPAKTLLYSASVGRIISRVHLFGFTLKSFKSNLDLIVRRAGLVAGQLRADMEADLRERGVRLYSGTGKLIGGGKVEVSSGGTVHILSARTVIVAAGSRPRRLESLPVDGRNIWDYGMALAPKRLPSSLAIIGAGAIGMEFAGFYSAMGTRVSVVDKDRWILGGEDHEVSEFCQRSREAAGTRFYMGAEVAEYRDGALGVRLTLASTAGSTQTLRADKVLVAVGMEANLEGLGLENTKARVAKGRIMTDKWGRTADPHVYAIGDVAARPWLAHKAIAEAVACVEHIARAPSAQPVRYENMPSLTYSEPKVGSVGLSQEEAARGKIPLVIGRADFKRGVRSVIAADAEGFVKLMFNAKTLRLVGMAAVGSGVGEVLAAGVAALAANATLADMERMVFAYPSYAESLSAAVRDARTRLTGVKASATAKSVKLLPN